MQVTLNIATLKKNFSFLSKVANRAKKSINEDYKCVQFFFDKHHLHLYTFDGEYFCKTTYPDVVTEEELSCLMDFSTLNTLLSLADEETIVFDFKTVKASIKIGKNRYYLQFNRESDFTEVYKSFIFNDMVLTTTGEELLKIFSFVSPCITDSNKLSRFKGVFFDGNFVTTDEASIAYYPYKDKGFNNHNFFMVKDGISMLQSISDEDMITVHRNESHIKYNINDESFFIIPQLSINFVNYKNIVNKLSSYDTFITVEKAALSKACSRLLAFSDGFVRQIGTFVVDANGLNIEGKSENKEAMEWVNVGDTNVTSFINFKFVLDLKRLLSYINGISSSLIILKLPADTAKATSLLIQGDGDVCFYTESILK